MPVTVLTLCSDKFNILIAVIYWAYLIYYAIYFLQQSSNLEDYYLYFIDGGKGVHRFWINCPVARSEDVPESEFQSVRG